MPSWRRLGGCLEGVFGVFWRFGDVLEPSWRCVLAFWRRHEEFLAPLGGGLKPRVDQRTILMRLGGGLEASCGRLEGVLEASWRRLGGVLELP